MDAAFRSPLIDCFRRGEVPREVRLLAARGAVAPRAHEQLALLVLLAGDADAEVALVAEATLSALPGPALAAFLGRADVTDDLRAFFAARGITPAAPAASDAPFGETDDAPLPDVDLTDGGLLPSQAGAVDRPPPISSLPVIDRIKLAMRGTREQRGVLVRDANRLVSAAVLSSPKLTETEVETFARMANVSDEVLRVIGTNRHWTKNYTVVASLVRNPKTPPAISLPLVARLNDRDVKSLAVDRNVPEGLRLSARKILATTTARKK